MSKFRLDDVMLWVDHTIGRSTLSNVALVAAGTGLLLLLVHMRRRRREASIRAEIRSYLGVNGSLNVHEQSAIDRLTSRVEELEHRTKGLEHDIRVIVKHLESHRQPPSNTATSSAEPPKPLTRAA